MSSSAPRIGVYSRSAEACCDCSGGIAGGVGGTWDCGTWDCERPWVHYVPIRRDLRDLDEALMRLQRNVSLADSIAAQGRAQAMRVFARRAVEVSMTNSLVLGAVGNGKLPTGHT